MIVHGYQLYMLLSAIEAILGIYRRLNFCMHVVTGAKYQFVFTHLVSEKNGDGLFAKKKIVRDGDWSLCYETATTIQAPRSKARHRE